MGQDRKAIGHQGRVSLERMASCNGLTRVVARCEVFVPVNKKREQPWNSISQAE